MSESAAAKLAALSLHDALPIFALGARDRLVGAPAGIARGDGPLQAPPSTAEVVTGTQQLRVDEIRELDPDLIVATPTTDLDRKSTRLNSSHGYISYAVFCLKKK